MTSWLGRVVSSDLTSIHLTALWHSLYSVNSEAWKSEAEELWQELQISSAVLALQSRVVSSDQQTRLSARLRHQLRPTAAAIANLLTFPGSVLDGIVECSVK